MDKIDIKSLSFSDLCLWLDKNGEPSFRAKQISEWLYKPTICYGGLSFDSMTNLSKTLREKLAKKFYISLLNVSAQCPSLDGTVKYVLKANDGVEFECVAIPDSSEDKHSLTVCVSSQAGCKMGCKFCATGRQTFYRNLGADEIYDQVRLVGEKTDRPVTNVVVMGQGEPFNNFTNLTGALDLINDKRFMNIGARKITVSTCGVLKGIEKFSSVGKQYGLAISLHSCIQSSRNELMPGVAKWPLVDLRHSIEAYIDATNRRPTFEYIMLDGINDDDEHLRALINFCKDMLCHVNLLSYNKVECCSYLPSHDKTIYNWITELNDCGITATHRRSRGSDVAGACGQLINK